MTLKRLCITLMPRGFVKELDGHGLMRGSWVSHLYLDKVLVDLSHSDIKESKDEMRVRMDTEVEPGSQAPRGCAGAKCCLSVFSH